MAGGELNKQLVIVIYDFEFAFYISFLPLFLHHHQLFLLLLFFFWILTAVASRSHLAVLRDAESVHFVVLVLCGVVWHDHSVRDDDSGGFLMAREEA